MYARERGFSSGERAVTVHIAFIESQSYGTERYEREKAEGVGYLDQLLAALNTYSRNSAYFATYS
jgi:hypothetical protein